MMRSVLILVFLGCISIYWNYPTNNDRKINASNGTLSAFEGDSIMVEELLVKADSMLYHLQYHLANKYFKQVLPMLKNLAQSTEDSITWVKYATTFYNLGYTSQELFEIDSSIYFLNQCLKITQERFGKIHLLIPLVHRKMEKNYLFKGEYSTARKGIFEGFEISLKLKDQNDLFLGLAYQSMAYQNFLLNDREKMEIYYNKTEDIYESLYKKQDLSLKTDKTKRWSWKFPNSIIADFPRHYIDYHLRTAYNHLMVGRKKNAKYAFNLANQCYVNNPQIHNIMKFRINNIRAHLHIFNDEFETALNLADSLIEFTQRDFNKYIFIDAYETKALTYETMGRFELAYQCMKKCFELYKPNGDEGIMLYMHSRLAQLALNAKRMDISRSIVDSMIGKIMPDLNWDNAEPIKWNGKAVYILKNILPLLKHKFLIEFSALSNSPESGESLKALKIFKSVHEATVLLHERIYTDVNRLVHEHDHHLLYEKAIRLIKKLYNESGNESFLLQGLKWSEASKSIILTREIASQNQSQHLTESNTQPLVDDIRRKIRSINYKLTELNLSDTSQDSKIRLQVQGQLASLYGEMEVLKERHEKELESGQASQIKNEFPIKSIRKKLKADNAVLLDFFYGDSLVSIHFVTPDTLMSGLFDKSPEFERMVIQFIDHIKSPGQSSLKKIDSIGRILYTLLLEPFAPFIAGKELVIIPDGMFSFLPFEYLMLYDQIPVITRYDYSSGLYLYNAKKTTQQKYVGFAPEYSGNSTIVQSRGDSILLDDLYSDNRAGLGRLKFNIPEVRESSKILSGLSFTGKKINKRVFFNNARKAGILHLALHALANDQNPDYSLFLLNSDREDFEPLYSFQIKELDLNADLAILSACNTGAGKYQHGNGVESLAKAFKQAGCKNIIMSLWPVNDASTKEIVVGFIKNLKAGFGKADALAKSKQDFLQSAATEFKHPYYWAGLVLIGDNEKMNFSRWDWKWIVAFISISGWLFLLSIRKLSKSRSQKLSIAA